MAYLSLCCNISDNHREETSSIAMHLSWSNQFS